MRLAICQFDVRPNMRSRNLGVAREAVRAAAKHDPAPDLIALPGVCDAGVDPQQAAGLTRAMCQGFAQSVATMAREWGVWIACGHSMVVADRSAAVVSLFDPDGDTFMRFPRIELTDGGDKIIPVATNIGVIAVAPISWIASIDPGKFEGIDLFVALGGEESDDEARTGCDKISGLGALVCVVRRASSGTSAASRVVGRKKETLAEVAAGMVGIAHVELPITPRAVVDGAVETIWEDR